MTKYRLLYQSRKNPGNPKEGDVFYSLVGKKSCPPKNSCSFVFVNGGRKMMTCACKIKADKIYLTCPECKHEGYLHLATGVTALYTEHTYTVFQAKGTNDEITFDKIMTCCGCYAQYRVQKGLMEKIGTYKLPVLNDKQLEEYLAKNKAFLDIDAMIAKYGGKNVVSL